VPGRPHSALLMVAVGMVGRPCQCQDSIGDCAVLENGRISWKCARRIRLRVAAVGRRGCSQGARAKIQHPSATNAGASGSPRRGAGGGAISGRRSLPQALRQPAMPQFSGALPVAGDQGRFAVGRASYCPACVAAVVARLLQRTAPAGASAAVIVGSIALDRFRVAGLPIAERAQARGRTCTDRLRRCSRPDDRQHAAARGTWFPYAHRRIVAADLGRL